MFGLLTAFYVLHCWDLLHRHNQLICWADSGRLVWMCPWRRVQTCPGGRHRSCWWGYVTHLACNGLEKVTGMRMVWAFPLRLCPHELDPDMEEDGIELIKERYRFHNHFHKVHHRFVIMLVHTPRVNLTPGLRKNPKTKGLRLDLFFRGTEVNQESWFHQEAAGRGLQLALPVLQESRVLRAKGAQSETKVSQVPQDSQP